MQKTSYVCDVCGAVKKEANHWWGIRLYGSEEMRLYRWGSYPASASGKISHLCGRACVGRKIEEFMQSQDAQSLEPPSGAVSQTKESPSERKQS